jgi:hypothetical protein
MPMARIGSGRNSSFTSATRGSHSAIAAGSAFVQKSRLASQARWSGRLTPRFTEACTIHAVSNDGVRVRVNGKTIIEQNIVRNNAAAAVGGIYLEGAAGKSERYTVYLVNNLIHGNQSTTTDASWNRGVGGVDIMYPAGASFVNSNLFVVNEQKYFASTDGSYIDQDIHRIWAPFTVTAF